MKLETTITERDKKLLKILAVVLIVFVVGWLVIRPTFLHMTEEEERRELLEARYQELEIRLASEEAMRLQLEDAKESYEVYSETLYPFMSNREIDRLITGLVLEHGLDSSSLSIVEGHLEELNPYYASEKALTGSADSGRSEEELERLRRYAAEEAAGMEPENPVAEPAEEEPQKASDLLDEYDNSPAEETTEVITGTQTVYTARVTCTANGTYENIKGLLDEVADTHGLRLTGFSLQPVLSSEEEQWVTIQFSLDIYMCRE